MIHTFSWLFFVPFAWIFKGAREGGQVSQLIGKAGPRCVSLVGDGDALEEELASWRGRGRASGGRNSMLGDSENRRACPVQGTVRRPVWLE